MPYLGDYRANQIIDFKFTTLSTALTGAPGAFSSGDLCVYKDNSATQSTAGVVLTSTFDSIVGLNHVRISTTADGTFYADGSDYTVTISTGAVGSVSLLGYTVASFSMANRSALIATSTGRTLDVTSGGNAGIDWANLVGSTATNALTGTVVSSAQIVASVTGNVGGNVTGSVGSLTTASAGSIGAGSFATDALSAAALSTAAVDKIQSGLSTPTQIADAFLDRDMIAGTDSGTTTFRTPRQALRFLRNKWVVGSTNTLTVYKEDDTVASWTAVMTVTSSADPITGSDPAG